MLGTSVQAAVGSGGALAVAAALLLAASGACASNRPPRPAHVQAVDLAPEERLGVDDVVHVQVWNEVSLTADFRVSADGTIDYPLVGRVAVLGMRSGDLQLHLTQKLKEGFVKSPQVSVMVKEWNSRKVSVLGQVRTPGSVAYFPNMTIVDAIASAGGFTAIAKINSVTLRRERAGKVESSIYPVGDISEGRAANVVLRPRDVVVVEERMF